jgi:predicted ABC-class ATPase
MAYSATFEEKSGYMYMGDFQGVSESQQYYVWAIPDVNNRTISSYRVHDVREVLSGRKGEKNMTLDEVKANMPKFIEFYPDGGNDQLASYLDYRDYLYEQEATS